MKKNDRFCLGLCLTMVLSLLPLPALAQDIPYREGPEGGQIIDLDELDSGRKPTRMSPTGEGLGASDGQATPKPQPAVPAPGQQADAQPDWERLRQMVDPDRPDLQQIQPSDFERLHEEKQARDAVKEKKQKFQEEYRARKEKKNNFKDQLKDNLADKRQGRKAGRARTPSAQELDLMMEKLLDSNVSHANKQRIAAVLFVHQDIYRNAVSEGFFGGDTAKVQEFLKWKEKLQADVIQRMGVKYKNQYGTALKAPVIPFSYNNIMSDDDIITGSNKTGQIMEQLYVDSLDEVIRERAGRPMTAADRIRVDVNGLAWDMTQKGALDNFWHKEKYINPQSGYANQEKLIAAGDDVKVYTFDDDGRMVLLTGTEAAAAIKRLDVDVPLKIPGMDLKAGTGSMSDYIRMADMHKITFKEKIVTIEEIQAFVRNQKYSERVDGDFQKLAAGTHPELVKEHARFMEVSRKIRKQLKIKDVAKILQDEYKITILDKNGIVDFEALTRAIQLHQNKQLAQVLPQMMGAVASNESYKMAKWLKTASGADRAMLRKQMALRYMPLKENQLSQIKAQLDKMTIPDADRVFLKDIIDKDVKQLLHYVDLMGMQKLGFATQMRITGDNHKLANLFTEKARFKDLNNTLARHKGGGKFKEFLTSKTARALNMDLMLGLEATTTGGKVIEGGGKLMQASLLILAAQRAYANGIDETDSIKQMAFAMFNTIPLVAAVLRTSEGEYREAAKEFMMDALPPLALADLAAQGLKYAADVSIDMFTESKLDQIAQGQLDQMDDSYFVESQDIPGFYQIKNRAELLEYMDEVSSALGRLAKFPSLITQHIDAKMQTDQRVQLNNRALVTCLWFEGYTPDKFGGADVMDFAMQQFATVVNSVLTDQRIADLKARVYEQGLPALGKASPVERVAAKIILENTSIRAEIYEQELHAFIERIENLYNQQKGESQSSNDIIEQAIKKLQELHQNAPAKILDSPNGERRLEEEFIKQENYLTSYHPQDIRPVELQREMQERLDNFRTFIDKLAMGIDFWLEKRYLDLKADYYGGTKNMEPLHSAYVLGGDVFRLGISARVNDRRKKSKWTVYYYMFTGDRWTVLGQKRMKPGRYRPENPAEDVLWEVVAPEKDSFININRSQLETYFLNVPGVYRVYPVLAFGNWERDPLGEVGYTALQQPIEYAHFFEKDKMAFIGEPLDVRMARASVYLDIPPTVYSGQSAQFAIAVYGPEYAGGNAEIEEVEVLSAQPQGPQPKVSTSKVKRISADSLNPTRVDLRFPEDAPEGQYVLTARVRMRGMLEEFQPKPVSAFFDYVKAEPPADETVVPTVGNMTEWLQKIKELEQQVLALKDQIAALAERLQTVAEYIQDKSGQIEQQLDGFGELSSDPGGVLLDDSVLGQVRKIKSKATRMATLRTDIENETLILCRGYENMKDVDKVNDLDVLMEVADTAYAKVGELYQEYTELQQQLRESFRQTKKTLTQLTALMNTLPDPAQLDNIREALEGLLKSQASLAQLENGLRQKSQDCISLNTRAALLVEQIGPDLSEEDAPLAQQIVDIYHNIDAVSRQVVDEYSHPQDLDPQMRERLVVLNRQLTVMTATVQAQSTQTGRSLEQSGKDLADLLAQMEAAWLFEGSITEAQENAGVCLRGSQDLYAQKASPENREAQADCSDFPGTQPRWYEDEREVRCECSDENKKYNSHLGRCATREEFEVAKVSCEDFPGTEARWHPETQDVRCDCVEPDQKYVERFGRCMTREDFSVATADCSQWKHAQAVWNAEEQQAECDCIGDYEWNANNDACRVKKDIQMARFDCSEYAHSTVVWSADKEKPYCDCLGDYESNNAKDACRVRKDIQLAQLSCWDYPGTSPRWDPEQERARCYCDEGVWNDDYGRCISRREQALAELNCRSCEEPYYDEKKGRARCVCAPGCDYDSKISDDCMPKEKLARLQRQRQEEIREEKRRREEERRRREAEEAAEQRAYCNDTLAQLNRAARKGDDVQMAIQQMFAMQLDCPRDEVRAAEQGRWRGSTTSGQGSRSSGSGSGPSGGTGDIILPDANIEDDCSRYPNGECPSGIFGTVPGYY
jgi:hypothetical protein